MTVDELAAKVAARYPQERMDAIAREHGTGHWTKFWDVDTYAKRGATKAFECGLFGSPPEKVLDIGAGLGYFATAAMLLGHQVAAIEINHPVTNEIYSRQFFDAKRKQEPHVSYALFSLRAQQPLFDLPPWCPKPYDLITLMGVNLCSAPGTYFNEAEYQFLIDDLWDRLNPSGAIWLEPNHGPEIALWTMRFTQPFTRARNVIRIGPHP